MHGRFGNNQMEAGAAKGRGMGLRTGAGNPCGEPGTGRGGGLGRNFARRDPAECTASKERLQAQRDLLQNRIEMIDKRLETL